MQRIMQVQLFHHVGERSIPPWPTRSARRRAASHGRIIFLERISPRLPRKCLSSEVSPDLASLLLAQPLGFLTGFVCEHLTREVVLTSPVHQVGVWILRWLIGRHGASPKVDATSFGIAKICTANMLARYPGNLCECAHMPSCVVVSDGTRPLACRPD